MALAGTVFRLAEQIINAHFWIVISEPMDGKVLCANITDGDKCPDSPCHLSIGDHPCITKPSAIIYRRAKEFNADKIAAEMKNPSGLRFLDPLNSVLLARVVEGAKTADDLTAKYLNYLK